MGDTPPGSFRNKKFKIFCNVAILLPPAGFIIMYLVELIKDIWD